MMISPRQLLVSLFLAVMFSVSFLGSPASASPVAVEATASVQAVSASSGKVTVPSRYVYNPNTSYQRTLHDYCSYSPDGWYSADFRGPCARHDLCIMERSKSRSGCDSDLKANMKKNCEFAFGSWDPRRPTCKGIANGYYAAVSAKTMFT